MNEKVRIRQEKISRYVRFNPGKQMVEIANALGYRQQMVKYHILRLITKGLIADKVDVFLTINCEWKRTTYYWIK